MAESQDHRPLETIPEERMKRIIAVLLLGAAGFAGFRQWSQRKREAALWAEATDRV